MVKTSDASDKTEDIDADFESELDDNYENFSGEGRSVEDIQREKEKYIHLREQLIKYKDSEESDDDDSIREKVLVLKRRK